MVMIKETAIHFQILTCFFSNIDLVVDSAGAQLDFSRQVMVDMNVITFLYFWETLNGKW